MRSGSADSLVATYRWCADCRGRPEKSFPILIMDFHSLSSVLANAELSPMHQPLFGIDSGTITGWKIVGYVGTILFAGRWLVQLWASKRSKQVTMPRMFWYMSIVGSMMALAYFIYGKNDSVGILQNSFPFVVACYNLYLDISHKRRSMGEDA